MPETRSRTTAGEDDVDRIDIVSEFNTMVDAGTEIKNKFNQMRDLNTSLRTKLRQANERHRQELQQLRQQHEIDRQNQQRQESRISNARLQELIKRKECKAMYWKQQFNFWKADAARLQSLLEERDQERKTMEHLICSICVTYTKSIVTPCGHGYCKDCLFEWLEESRTCPDCRRHTTRGELIHLYLDTSTQTEASATARDDNATTSLDTYEYTGYPASDDSSDDWDIPLVQASTYVPPNTSGIEFVEILD
ncbi:hypothetical protein H2198_006264 [Neophaeococcomyces mojaviensis]|uniref:Uncharacterized protein n=1 Tax=Neophaeococcomyces mojaviensis TaxID=3383035 RepID=A0ACC3A3W4_9EURO|nr:hypothetical protein H2198_006264 [Knufia sp. JES_112]